ncbi:MAG: permease [Psychromonas sp.]|nr:permease [Psychromonas sp.]
MLLFLSVIALFLGPITYRILQRQPSWLDLLDSFIFVTISGLVIFDILPELLSRGGMLCIILMAAGIFMPSWIEKHFHKSSAQAHQTTLFLAVAGLVLHAGIDGTALAIGSKDQTAWLLAIGVLLHRFPVGLTIWWLLYPQYGRKLPLIILCCMGVATLLGAFYAQSSMISDTAWITWLQAFIMGSILHIVIHRPYLQPHKKDPALESKYVEGIGSILGLFILSAILLPHWLGYLGSNHESHQNAPIYQTRHRTNETVSHDQKEISVSLNNNRQDSDSKSTQDEKSAITFVRFSNLALKIAPFLLVAYFLSSLMHYFNPKRLYTPRRGSKQFLKESLRGVAVGLPLPICSPAATKMHQTFLKQGANQTFATAFLIATPIIGFDSLSISLPLLGGQFFILRILLAIIFAVTIAWLLGRHFKKVIILFKVENCQHIAPSSNIISTIKHAYQHQLDHTAPWVIFGCALAATLSATHDWVFFEQALWLQIIVMIIIAFPFALCATGITPIIAILLLEGLSPGAGIAFLLIAPTISIDLLKQLKEQQGFFAAASLSLLMFIGAFVIGLVLNQYISTMPLQWFNRDTHGYHWLQYVSLILICILYLGSLLRRGARSFIEELIPKSLLKHDHYMK